MKPEVRAAIVRWVVAAGTVVWMARYVQPLQPGLVGWVLIGTLVVLIAAVQNLGIRVTYGEATFVPVATLMAYFALGLNPGIPVVAGGLLIGGAIQAVRNWKLPEHQGKHLLIKLIFFLWPVAHNGLALMVADFAYRLTGEPAPLTSITTMQDMTPVLAAPVLYLIVYDLLLVAGLVQRGLPIGKTLIENRRNLLAIQLLPMALAPFSAIALANIGLWAFIMFELILMTVVIAVFYLMMAHGDLEQRVDQLNSFSTIARALRTTLERPALLDTVFTQTASLLKVSNYHIILKDTASPTEVWIVAFAVENQKTLPNLPAFRTNGFLKYILEKQQPLLAPRLAETAAEMEIADPPQGRSWMGMPLIASGRLLGCMVTWVDVDDVTDRVFNQADFEVFSAIGAQTAVALDNSLLYEASRQQTSQLTRLNQISAVMNASLNPARVLDLIGEAVTEVSGCDKTAIYLFQTETQPETDMLVLAHAQGFTPEHVIRSRDIAIPLTETERRMVLEAGSPVWASDINSGDVQVSPAALLIGKRENFSAYAYFPLRSQLKPIGVLGIYYTRPHNFSKIEIDLLETFGNQAALSITNARIYHTVDIQSTQRLEQITRMSEINQRLSATLDMSKIFNLIIEAAMEGCKADAGVLVLTGDPEMGQTRGDLNMVAWRGFDPAVSSTHTPHHVAETIAREVLIKGETIVSSLDDPNQVGPRSQLCVPITLDSKVIGALAVESEHLNAFSDHDLAFAGQLAVQAAVAIRNAQLYNNAQGVRDRLHAILDSSDDGLVMLDPRGRVVMTNTRMSEFWTFANTNLTPRSVEQISRDPLSSLGEGLGYQEGQLSGVLGRYTRNPIVKPETDLYEVRGASGQRQRFVERTTTAVRDEQGNFIGLLLIFHDVTKQKELDEARENLTQLIVHDLRSPLQSVMGSMRLINQFLPEKPAEVEQATQISERAVKKLLNLVNNLLDISSMESGKFSLRAEVESAASIIRDVADNVIGLSEDANAVVKVELPAELPFVEVDRSMIERVVLNLVDNALKHTTPGTLVRVTAAKQAASEAAAGPMVLIQVIDNGPGVPNDFKEKIFDRFTQVPGQKSQRRSTGLGLAFCLMAVENHGGKIWVEDNPDGGSIFSVLLPAASVPAEHITERTKTAEAKPIKPIRSKGASSETPKKSASAKPAPSD